MVLHTLSYNFVTFALPGITNIMDKSIDFFSAKYIPYSINIFHIFLPNCLSSLQYLILLVRTMIKHLSGWSEHTAGTAGTAGTGKCQKFGENCPFMGKMPPLLKIGNTANDDTDTEEYAYNIDSNDEEQVNDENDANASYEHNDDNDATQGKPVDLSYKIVGRTGEDDYEKKISMMCVLI